MRILLLQPYHSNNLTYDQNPSFEHLASFIREAILCVEIEDAQCSKWGDSTSWEEALSLGKCLKVLYIHIEHLPAYKVAHQILKGLEAGKAEIVIVGGTFVQSHPSEVATNLNGIDALIPGETDLTLKALIECIFRSEEWRNLKGLAIPENNKIRYTLPRPLPKNLHHLKMPLFDFYNKGIERKGHHLLVSRGCRNNCSYCGLQTPDHRAWPGQWDYWRARSSADIISEIDYCSKTFGVTQFFLNSHVTLGYDTAGTTLLSEIAEGILQKKLNIELNFVSHPLQILKNRAILPLLKRAGLRQVTLGLDSGVARAKNLYGLSFKNEDSIDALKTLYELQIEIIPVFIFYDPYMALEEVPENLNFLQKAKPYLSTDKMTYARVLEQFFLNTTLVVSQGMPIYNKLVTDNLCTPCSPIEKRPAVRFQFPTTGKFYQVHNMCNKYLLPKIRPFLHSHLVIKAYPELDDFLIDMLSKIKEILNANDSLQIEEIFSQIKDWAGTRLISNIFKMGKILLKPEEELEELAIFFSNKITSLNNEPSLAVNVI